MNCNIKQNNVPTGTTLIHITSVKCLFYQQGCSINRYVYQIVIKFGRYVIKYQYVYVLLT